MPTYEYRCKDCGHTFDAVQSFSDDALTVCPECGGALKKVFGNVGIAFKGSGFYVNDSGSKKSTTSAASDGSSGSSGDRSSGGSEGSSNNASTSSDSSKPADSKKSSSDTKAKSASSASSNG